MNHRVAQGETLSTIAARYNTTPEAIARANKLPGTNRIDAQQVLKIPTAAEKSAARRAKYDPDRKPERHHEHAHHHAQAEAKSGSGGWAAKGASAGRPHGGHAHAHPHSHATANAPEKSPAQTE